MAHTTAARNDERALIFKIILRRLLHVLLQLEYVPQALDESQPPLREATSLPLWSAYTCNEILGGIRRR